MFQKLNFLLLLLTMLFICGCDPFDTQKVKMESQAAFNQAKFMDAPFKKAAELKGLTDFLIVHGDTLVNYARSQFLLITKDYTVSDPPTISDKDFVYRDPYRKDFIETYIPVILRDSIDYHLAQVGSNIIKSFRIELQRANPQTAQVKIDLNYPSKGKEEEIILSYYLQHSIIANVKPHKEALKFKDDSFNDLVKVRPLQNGLHYEIIVSPYVF